jgi:hypothetical protein
MEIEVKVAGQLITFNEWNKNFNFYYKSIKLVDGRPLPYSGQEVVLYQKENKFYPVWFGHKLHPISAVHFKIYPDHFKYFDKVDECKDHIDHFLLRFNNFSPFI